MPTPEQQQSLSEALEAIHSAQSELIARLDVEEDPLASIRLTYELSNLDARLCELLRAQNAADDQEYSQALLAFKARCSGLEADQRRIQSLLSHEETAMKVIGHLARAARTVSTL